MIDFKQTLKLFETEFGFEFLKKTRKREYVEARATFIYYLYKYKKIGLSNISRLIYRNTGWKINHATVFHSIKLWDMYSKYNPQLDTVLKRIIGQFDNDNDKIEYIKNTVSRLSSGKIDIVHQKILDYYERQVIEDQLQDAELNDISDGTVKFVKK